MTLLHGQNTDIDATEEVIDATDRGTKVHVMLIKAPAANTGIVYVGATGVLATNGLSLSAGEAMRLKLNDINLGSLNNTEVFAIADTANQKLEYLYQ